MSSSWNWHIIEFNEHDRRHFAGRFNGVGVDPRWAESEKHWASCRKKRCGRMAEVYVRYYYVTGRAGRLSCADRPYCREHGEQLVASKAQVPA